MIISTVLVLLKKDELIFVNGNGNLTDTVRSPGIGAVPTP